MKDGSPIMVFECKHVASELTEEKAAQFYRYLTTSDANCNFHEPSKRVIAIVYALFMCTLLSEMVLVWRQFSAGLPSLPKSPNRIGFHA